MLKHSNRIGCFCLILMGIALAMTGCAPPSYLAVDYQLPPKSLQLDGQQVHLQIRDVRPEKRLLTPAAAVEIKPFDDSYNLTYIEGQKNRQKAGLFDFEALLRETFDKRLQLMGAHVVRSSRVSAPEFVVEISEMVIDLKDHNWMARMTCRVILAGDNGKEARQDVSGTAQRTQIIGRKGADTVLSDLFTDVINRVDLLRLFEQAGRL